eukprot:scaffold134295_cov27-Tisochrysis_lutea.AAC.1
MARAWRRAAGTQGQGEQGVRAERGKFSNRRPQSLDFRSDFTVWPHRNRNRKDNPQKQARPGASIASSVYECDMVVARRAPSQPQQPTPNYKDRCLRASTSTTVSYYRIFTYYCMNICDVKKRKAVRTSRGGRAASCHKFMCRSATFSLHAQILILGRRRNRASLSLRLAGRRWHSIVSPKS